MGKLKSISMYSNDLKVTQFISRVDSFTCLLQTNITRQSRCGTVLYCSIEFKFCTGAAELLALDLTDAFVGETSGTCAAGAAGLDWVRAQIISQPLKITVADEWILC